MRRLRYLIHVRLHDYDYSQPGYYFVTICTSFRRCVLGSIVEDTVQLSPAGDLVASIWQGLPERFSGIGLDAWVVMPNHLHGIVVLSDEMDTRPALGTVIRAFKGASSHHIRLSGMPDFRWQPNYYDHVIRNEAELARIRRYIVENPLKWALDEENPDRVDRL